MKIKGDELARFMVEGWPEPEDDWYWDHDVFDEPDPAATYETSDIGPILYQGSRPENAPRDGLDLDKLIRAWRKRRDAEIVSVLVPRSQMAEFLKAITACGAKVER